MGVRNRTTKNKSLPDFDLQITCLRGVRWNTEVNFTGVEVLILIADDRSLYRFHQRAA
jgi:hypothetical protein